MKYSEAIKPISCFKNNMAKVIRDLNENRSTILTQNGEAKAAVVDIRQYEELLETVAMLELTAQGKQDLTDRKFRPARDVFSDMKHRISREPA